MGCGLTKTAAVIVDAIHEPENHANDDGDQRQEEEKRPRQIVSWRVASTSVHEPPTNSGRPLREPKNKMKCEETIRRDETPSYIQSLKKVEKKALTTSFHSLNLETRTAKTMQVPTKDLCNLVFDPKLVSIWKRDSFTMVNQYKIIRTIGRGSFGKVKLVQHAGNGQLFALKCINRNRLLASRPFQPDYFKNLLREVAIMKKVRHENCVQLFEALDDSTAGRIFLVLEYVSGGAVMSSKNTKPLDLDLAWSYFRDLVSGLEYLHFHRITHRDIKPENMLVSHTGKLKLSDFGMSVIHPDGKDETSMSPATPAFTAPEAMMGMKYSAKMADVWAMGISLCNFVSGSVPWSATSILEMRAKVMYEPLSLPVNLPPPLIDLLRKLLVKEPADRMTLAECKQHPWVTKDGKYPLPDGPTTNHLEISVLDMHTAFVTFDPLTTLIKVKDQLNRIDTQPSLDDSTTMFSSTSSLAVHGAPPPIEMRRIKSQMILQRPNTPLTHRSTSQEVLQALQFTPRSNASTDSLVPDADLTQSQFNRHLTLSVSDERYRMGSSMNQIGFGLRSELDPLRNSFRNSPFSSRQTSCSLLGSTSSVIYSEDLSLPLLASRQKPIILHSTEDFPSDPPPQGRRVSTVSDLVKFESRDSSLSPGKRRKPSLNPLLT